MQQRLKYSSFSQRGMSLVEFAIVLGIAALIFGGIWAMATQMYGNVKQERLTEQITIIVKNFRNAYMSKAYADSTLVSTMMPKLTAMKIFPGDTLHSVGAIKVVDSPFGETTNPISAASPYNSIYVCGWKSNSSTSCEFTAPGTLNTPFFAVELLVPVGAECLNAVLRNAGSAASAGLLDVAINGNKALANGFGLPATVTYAKQYCMTPYPGSTSTTVVDFIYLVSPQ